MGKSIRSFVGSELSFLKLVSVLVGLSGGVSNFSSKGIDRLSSHSSMRLRHKTSCGSSLCTPHNRDNPLST